MHDPFAASRRLAQRVLIAQLGVSLIAALIAFAADQRWQIGLATIWGGTAVAVAHGVFALMQLRGGIANVPTLARRFFAAAAWKWVVLFGLFATGLSLDLSAPAMLAGLVVALITGIGALLRYG